MISGINHITFAVSDLDRSLSFYRDVLGTRTVYVWDAGAYLDAGGLWLCLSVEASAHGGSDYTHVAFNVEAAHFPLIRDRVLSSGVKLWKENQSEGESLYFCCPDGHRLELHVGDIDSRLAAIRGRQQGRCDEAQ
ncbi:MAG: VOC family protein [Pseudomonadota bacterium]